MKNQILELWADALSWMKAHVAVTCLIVAVFLVTLIAVFK